ncbi:Zinc finger and SCAN domain-containing protein 29 [Chelonia mydas]|uniref:Zinc finger and SCAN domain-containing protein 29 n=1 Tax=Chelonia mydas TaxID=8469 RepID=M7BZN2_CHEMY|nr:Zinc finger and SCAN domain-containing protein 29 [Chelonia mydas]
MQSQNRKKAPAWTEWEVLDLIVVWGEESVLSELRSKRRNAKTFQKISEAMRDRGYNRDATQCHVKLKELRQAYQKTKESNGCFGTELQTSCFYAELHAILGGATTTTPPLSVDSDDGVLSAMPEDFADGEDEEDELEESSQHTILPESQDLFITLTEIPSQPNQAGEGTSAGPPGAGSSGDWYGLQSPTTLQHQDSGSGSQLEGDGDLPNWLTCLEYQSPVLADESTQPLKDSGIQYQSLGPNPAPT